MLVQTPLQNALHCIDDDTGDGQASEFTSANAAARFPASVVEAGVSVGLHKPTGEDLHRSPLSNLRVGLQKPGEEE